MTNKNTELERIIKDCFDEITYDTLKGKCRNFFNDIKKLPAIGNVSFSKPLDAIAYELYGDENLYYILATYNNIIDPLKIDNIYIKYPSKEDITTLLIRYSGGS